MLILQAKDVKIKSKDYKLLDFSKRRFHNPGYMERKLLLISTLLIFAIAAVVIYLTPEPKYVQVESAEEATFGLPKASVKVVIFEEFACSQCRRFHGEVMDALFDQFVQTGKVSLTLVPSAYLEGSLAPFAAAICAKKFGKTHLRGMIDYLFRIPPDILVSMPAHEFLAGYGAQKESFSMQEALKLLSESDIEKERERSIALTWALYDQEIHLPTVLVNGRKVFPADKQALFATIEAELRRQK